MSTFAWLLLAVSTIILLFHFVMPAYNGADWGSPFLNRLDGLNRLFCRTLHRLPADNFDLPETGPAIVASNHVSGLDAILLLAASPRPLRFMIAREQYERFGMQWLFHALGAIPVDRSGRPEKAMREAVNALKAGEVIAIFPHGKIHLPGDPPRKLKGGAARLAAISGCPVHALMIEGIRLKGVVVASVFVPSRATVKEIAVLYPEEGAHVLQEQLEKIYT
jgi:1-acyl-sn-glycerol-3-phosphate acyltransferase